MKWFFNCLFGLLLAGTVALIAANTMQNALSYAAGVFIVLFNVGTHYFVWSRFLRKKLIALALGIIVFKYAILGLIIYRLLHTDWLNPIWFSVGLSSLMVGSFIFALFGPTNSEESLLTEG
jgi:hypothetical protein